MFMTDQLNRNSKLIIMLHSVFVYFFFKVQIIIYFKQNADRDQCSPDYNKNAQPLCVLCVVHTLSYI